MVQRLATISHMLWTDLDSLFEIVVPSDLWAECKTIVAWPKEEPPRETSHNAASKVVMEKYKEVIDHLKKKVPDKEIN